MEFLPIILALSLWQGLFFWGILGAIFISICFEQGLVALLILTVGVIASYGLGYLTLDFVQQHQTGLLWLLAFYIPAGIVWATLRWYPIHVLSLRNKVKKYLNTEAQKLRAKKMTEDDFAYAMRQVRDNLSYKFEELPPRVYNHKGDFTRWMGWWPLSILSWVFGDMLRHLFTVIYEGFSAFWQRLSDRAFRGVDFANPPDPKV